MPKVKYTSAKGLHQLTGTNEVDLGPPDTVKVVADGAPSMQQLVFMYDFGTQGGSIGEITLTEFLELEDIYKSEAKLAESELARTS